jgi:LmbE family N-acetylglucosaminyl deacetylase
MGVSRLTFLGYVDQGLASADPKEASARVARVMASYRPDAVVTFGPEGIYQHPDHVAIHHLPVEAFARVWGGADGGASRPAPRLWYVALPSAFWRYRRDDWVAAGRDTGGAGETTSSRRPIEPGLPEAAIDIRGVLDRKIAALLAHRSQRHNVERTFGRFYDLALGRPKDPEALETMGREFFTLARGPRPRHVLEDGLVEPDA